MVTTNSVVHNNHYNMVQNEVTMDDLFTRWIKYKNPIQNNNQRNFPRHVHSVLRKVFSIHSDKAKGLNTYFFRHNILSTKYQHLTNFQIITFLFRPYFHNLCFLLKGERFRNSCFSFSASLTSLKTYSRSSSWRGWPRVSL